jgi:hypothetical protein
VRPEALTPMLLKLQVFRAETVSLGKYKYWMSFRITSVCSSSGSSSPKTVKCSTWRWRHYNPHTKTKPKEKETLVQKRIPSISLLISMRVTPANETILVPKQYLVRSCWAVKYKQWFQSLH